MEESRRKRLLKQAEEAKKRFDAQDRKKNKAYVKRQFSEKEKQPTKKTEHAVVDAKYEGNQKDPSETTTLQEAAAKAAAERLGKARKHGY